MRYTVGGAVAAELARALLENANDLLSESELLFDAGKYARAYALAALGLEEIGKIADCLDALTSPVQVTERGIPAWASHRQKANSHAAFELAFLSDLGSIDRAQLLQGVEDLLELKLASIYVDFVKGDIRRPRSITSGSAELLIQRLDQTCAYLRPYFDALSPEVIEQLLPVLPQLEAALRPVLDEEEPEASLMRVRKIVATSIGSSPDELRALLNEMLSPAVQKDNRS